MAGRTRDGAKALTENSNAMTARVRGVGTRASASAGGGVVFAREPVTYVALSLGMCYTAAGVVLC